MASGSAPAAARPAEGRPDGAPQGVDPSRPHPARVYDYLLGGKNSFAPDRELADKVLASVPSGRTAARENRAFAGRAVRYLAAEAGIRQFLDIGTGLPAAVNVHEVAQQAAPESRVVYVDNDPMVLAHARALLTSSLQGRTGYALADLRDPEGVLDSPAVGKVIDFTRPAALLLAGVLHLIPDEDDPGKIIATLAAALAPGSYLVASHLSAEHDRPGWAAVQRECHAAGMPVRWRDSGDFARLAFAGLELISPGVVPVSEWQPDTGEPRPGPAEVSTYGGLACKR